MTDQQLKDTWNQLSEQIQEIKNEVDLNRKKDKSRSILIGLLIRRSLEAFIFGIFTFILAGYFADSLAKPLVLMSIAVLLIFCLVGLVGNILQISALSEIDFAMPIAEFRRRIGKFKIYNLMTLKLIFLSVPFYMAYIILWFDFIGANFLEVADPTWILANTVMSGLLLVASIWFFRNLRHDSRFQWIQSLIRDNGGREIEEVADFISTK